jgi:hypothetical protein
VQGLLVTAVVLALVVAVSVVVLRLGGPGGAPVAGGDPSATAEPAAPPVETLPPGRLLARYSSEDGPDQDHTIRTGRLGVVTRFTCTGSGTWSVLLSGASGESGDGPCGGSGIGSGGPFASGVAHLRIRTDPGMRWTYTVVGIEVPAGGAP